MLEPFKYFEGFNHTVAKSVSGKNLERFQWQLHSATLTGKVEETAARYTAAVQF
ncbi:hypothetical protein BJV82DRAFT_600305 [Fennellomyces sp. T-0311]|nr:hypothetical protein BJV82DRAFT_600305 [Fennellomyces sp. T-0311]